MGKVSERLWRHFYIFFFTFISSWQRGEAELMESSAPPVLCWWSCQQLGHAHMLLGFSPTSASHMIDCFELQIPEGDFFFFLAGHFKNSIWIQFSWNWAADTDVTWLIVSGLVWKGRQAENSAQIRPRWRVCVVGEGGCDMNMLTHTPDSRAVQTNQCYTTCSRVLRVGSRMKGSRPGRRRGDSGAEDGNQQTSGDLPLHHMTLLFILQNRSLSPPQNHLFDPTGPQSEAVTSVQPTVRVVFLLGDDFYLVLFPSCVCAANIRVETDIFSNVFIPG